MEYERRKIYGQAGVAGLAGLRRRKQELVGFKAQLIKQDNPYRASSSPTCYPHKRIMSEMETLLVWIGLVLLVVSFINGFNIEQALLTAILLVLFGIFIYVLLIYYSQSSHQPKEV